MPLGRSAARWVGIRWGEARERSGGDESYDDGVHVLFSHDRSGGIGLHASKVIAEVKLELQRWRA